MFDRTLLDNLTYATLLSLDSGKSSGSGFLLNFNSKDYLITAKHVLFDEDKLRCERLLVSSQNSRGKNEEAIMFEVDMKQAKILKENTGDVTAILLGNISNNKLEDYITVIQSKLSDVYLIKKEQIRLLDEIGIANEVYLVGFPTSLITPGSKHFDPGKPLLRKGILAGINTEDQTFIIDCSAYYGNSGAPILELCGFDKQLRVVGIVSRYIPFVIEWRNNREISLSHLEYLNSGYSVCIPIDAIFELINKK